MESSLVTLLPSGVLSLQYKSLLNSGCDVYVIFKYKKAKRQLNLVMKTFSYNSVTSSMTILTKSSNPKSVPTISLSFFMIM